MTELKPCPCGKMPEKLLISEGSTFRWRYVEGDCGCGWMFETRINTMRKASGQEDYEECVEAWNAKDRVPTGHAPDKLE